MKFLLTSSGLTNQDIAKALSTLVGKPISETSLLFIPTAANKIMEDKGWLIENLSEIKDQGFKALGIVDIAVVDRDVWYPQMEEADVICFGGGNELYLAQVLKERNVKKDLEDLLETRVYMGISAGSMVAGKLLENDLVHSIYPEEVFEEESTGSLNFVDICFLPHMNSEYFKQATAENLESMKDKISYTTYATDDSTALAIDGDTVEVVGGGKFWYKE